MNSQMCGGGGVTMGEFPKKNIRDFWMVWEIQFCWERIMAWSKTIVTTANVGYLERIWQPAHPLQKQHTTTVIGVQMNGLVSAIDFFKNCTVFSEALHIATLVKFDDDL